MSAGCLAEKIISGSALHNPLYTQGRSLILRKKYKLRQELMDMLMAFWVNLIKIDSWL